MLSLTEINVYPIKSLAGIALQSAKVEGRGLQYDRRWMLVDSDGVFASQRSIPEMTRLGIALEEPFLNVFQKNNPNEKIQLPLRPDPVSWPRLQPRVEIWSDKCTAWVAPTEINSWFSDQLHRHLRLVYMPDTTRRRADGRYAPAGQYVSFADGFPYLLIGQASLNELNSRLEIPVPMNRFRPNFVFSGGQPYEEDHWSDFTIGVHPFRAVKPCGRCIVITTDQNTGQRHKEPLRTLATYRQKNNKILFGQNVIWMGEEDAWVHTGDPISVG